MKNDMKHQALSGWRRFVMMAMLVHAVPTALVLPSLAAHGAEAAKPASKPNVLIILVDDMGYGDPGCYNPHSKIATPNIDRLAREGIRFTDAHAPGPLCHASRYGLMTGRSPWRRNTPG